MPVACGVVALVMAGAGVAVALSARGGAVTSLVGVTAYEPLAPLAQAHDRGFSFSADHLDGAYFYAIAVDPLARGAEHELVDVPAYRFGHPGYGWLSWLLAFGRASAVPNAMLLIGLVSMFVAGVGASLLSVELGWSPWAGLAIAFNPGLLFATFADNSEPFAIAVLAGTLIAWMKSRYGWGAAGSIVLCLTKEQFVLVPVGLIIWELVKRRRAQVDAPPRRELLKRIAVLLPGPVALFGWFAYLHSIYGEWPFQQKPLLLNPLTIPPFGYFDTLGRAAAQHAYVGETAQLGGAAIPLLLVVGAALVLGIVRAARLRSPVDPVFILLTLLMFSLTWVQLLYPKDLMRIAAVQLALLPAAIAGLRGPPPDREATDTRLTRSPA